MVMRFRCLLSKCLFHMEGKFVDYYEKLGVDPNSTHEEIKKKYHKLVKKIHPDKKLHEECHAAEEDFVDVHKAWTVLSDEEQRMKYDRIYRENKLSSQGMIYDTILKNELISVQGESYYEYPCRCGGHFVFEEDDLKQGFELTECDSCSLLLKLDQ